MAKHGRAFLPYNPLHTFALKQIDKFKPQRILIIHHWMIYIDFKGMQPHLPVGPSLELMRSMMK
jgi:hypothetical protein